MPMKVTSTWVAIAIVGLAGCGGSTSATAPSATRVVTTATPAKAGVLAMKGTVSDGAFRPIAGASIEVLDGSQMGATTSTDSLGQFSFFGSIDDNTRFRATKDGYLPSVETLKPPCAPCNPARWVNFVLDATTPSVDMAGDYTVTLASACDTLPADLRRRTYGTTIGSSPYHGYVDLRLTGGTFVKGYDSLSMGIEADLVSFWIEILVDQVAPNAYLIIGGVPAAHVGAQAKETYVFPFDGSITYCRTRETGSFDDCFHNPLSSVTCPSGQLILTRR